MLLACYQCPRIFHVISDYTAHLRNAHLLFEPCILQCNVDGCHRTFTTYNALRKHIRKEHSSNMCNPINLANANNIDHVEEVNFVGPGNSEEELNYITDNENADNFEPPAVDEHGVSHAALKFLMALQSSSSLPSSTIEFMTACTQELLCDIISYLESKTIVALKAHNCSAETVGEMSEEFNKWKNPFKGIDKQYKLLRYLKLKGIYIEPEEEQLGVRWERKRDKKTKRQMQVRVPVNFQYIPIESTIRLVLQQPEAWNLLSSQRCIVNGLSEDWMDSVNGKKLQQYCQQRFPNSIPVFIQVYYDEVETTNPLGSKTGIYKLGAFYFVIKNFPPAANSALNNIHLLALAHSDDVKKYTIEPIIKVLVGHLQRLHDEGFTVQVNGEDKQLRCLLTQIVGDNLGLHSVLGYMENFSRTTFPCDLCMISSDGLQNIFMEKQLTMRTQGLYNMQVQQIQSGELSSKNCGIKRQSALVNLKYYHPACNDAADIMHDLFEGVLPCEVKLFLFHIIYDIKLISLDDVNYRIGTMDYGLVCNSKPSSLTESHLKSTDTLLGQRSAQMLTLFLFLPLILADIIEKVDAQKWRLYQLMKEITEIVLSPTLVTSHLTYLEDLISEHHELFKECYPHRPLLYKHHRMIHYGSVIRNSGPLLHMMVMRYEAKHNFFKRLAHIICNFKNITYSLSKRHQIAHGFAWTTKSPLKEKTHVENGVMISVSELCDKLLIIPYIGEAVDIFATERVVIFGQEYRCGMSVFLDLDADEEPIFINIEQICVHDDQAFFIGNKWIIHEYCDKLLSYCCTLEKQKICVKANELAQYKPLDAVTCLKPSCNYMHIILRHILCNDNSLLK